MAAYHPRAAALCGGEGECAADGEWLLITPLVARRRRAAAARRRHRSALHLRATHPAVGPAACRGALWPQVPLGEGRRGPTRAQRAEGRALVGTAELFFSYSWRLLRGSFEKTAVAEFSRAFIPPLSSFRTERKNLKSKMNMA